MKIQIDVDPAYDDIHIKIECGKLTPEIEEVCSLSARPYSGFTSHASRLMLTRSASL